MHILDSVNSIENLTLKAMYYMFFTAVCHGVSTVQAIAQTLAPIYTKVRHTQCVINCG